MSRSPHFTYNSWFQWAASVALWSALFVFFMQYHVIRGRTWEWFTANKCIAIASTFTMGLALALGPLSRWGARWQRYLPWRRPLGVVGGTMALTHLFVTLTVLANRFPWSWYVDHWFSTASSAAAAGLVAAATAISNAPARRWLGDECWGWWQSAMWWMWGLILLHLVFSGKALGWWKWLQTFDKPLPPGASITTLFVALVLALHLAQGVQERVAARRPAR